LQTALINGAQTALVKAALNNNAGKERTAFFPGVVYKRCFNAPFYQRSLRASFMP
jgi:hypothetical protein